MCGVTGFFDPSASWTADELSGWYKRYAEGSPHYSKLWYYGSDSDYHYFRCRAIDSWVHPRVPRDEIALQDVRPVRGTSSGPFPGYYAVDPSNGFKPIPVPVYKPPTVRRRSGGAARETHLDR